MGSETVKSNFPAACIALWHLQVAFTKLDKGAWKVLLSLDKVGFFGHAGREVIKLRLSSVPGGVLVVVGVDWPHFQAWEFAIPLSALGRCPRIASLKGRNILPNKSFTAD